MTSLQGLCGGFQCFDMFSVNSRVYTTVDFDMWPLLSDHIRFLLRMVIEIDALCGGVLWFCIDLGLSCELSIDLGSLCIDLVMFYGL